MTDEVPTGGFLLDAEAWRTPFPYFIAGTAFGRRTADDLLDWLSHDAPWKLTKKSFYEQYEFDFHQARLPPALAGPVRPDVLAALKGRVESFLSVRLRRGLTICAHKLLPGQGIGIHTDHCPGLETHRLVVFLNTGFQDSHGGHLVFFRGNDPSSIHRIFRPLHNTAVGFALAENAHHAVSDVRAGVRYSVIYSFWEDLPEGHPGQGRGAGRPGPTWETDTPGLFLAAEG